jgi:signal transduction histidine kinase
VGLSITAMTSRRSRQSQARGRAVSIVLAEPDAYLAYLIRLDLPDAEIKEAVSDDDLKAALSSKPDLILASLESPRASQILSDRGTAKVIGVADATRAAKMSIPPYIDDLILRPFEPAELHRAVRGSLGLPEPQPTARAPFLERVQSWLAPARVVAVVAAAIFQVIDPGSGLMGVPLTLAFLYSGMRLVFKRSGPVLVLVDAGIAGLLISTTGGMNSDYIFFGLVVAVESGLVLGIQGGSLVGLLIAGAYISDMLGRLEARTLDPGQLLIWVGLLPLAASAGGLAGTIWGGKERETAGVLAEANKVLSTLYRIARAMPGGLEIGSVTSGALEKVRESTRAPAAILLVEQAGILGVAGSFGLPKGEQAAIYREAALLGEFLEVGTKRLQPENLPPSLGSALADFPCWVVAHFQYDGSARAFLLAACTDHSRHDSANFFLQQVARETAIGLENATLFGRVQELSADEERRRLARELHDGVAQALTHIRLELEFLALHGEEEAVRGEMARLSRVVDRALSEVRATITGLTAAVTGEGLVSALKSYLRDLRGLGGPKVVFVARTDEVKLPPDVEADVFRIAQEAVSNALRHANAGLVRVSVDNAELDLRLVVDDDGVGFDPTLETQTKGSVRKGMGLQGMRKRADRIGARLSIQPRAKGGTRVELLVADGNLPRIFAPEESE